MVSIMNRLRTAQRVAVVKALVEGNSIRSTVRLTGVAKNTVTKLLIELGAAVAEYQDKTLVNLNSKRVQCDEIWSFCYAKKKTVQKDPTIKERNKDAGDVWTWTAIDADSKLCVSFQVGRRDAESAFAIMSDVRSRMANRIQLTTDQLSIYLKAVDRAFGVDVDYAMLQKIYAGGLASPSRTHAGPVDRGSRGISRDRCRRVYRHPRGARPRRLAEQRLEQREEQRAATHPRRDLPVGLQPLPRGRGRRRRRHGRADQWRLGRR